MFFRTVNGGDTWERELVVPSIDRVYAVGNSVFGLTDQTIVRSTDGGRTWTLQFSGEVGLFALSFVDENTGTVVGESGIILSTTDGGNTWTPQVSGTTVSLNAVCFVDANGWIVVGDAGTILRTTDGGATWTAQDSGTTNSLYAVSCVDANTAWVVGANGTIRYTTTAREVGRNTGDL